MFRYVSAYTMYSIYIPFDAQIDVHPIMSIGLKTILELMQMVYASIYILRSSLVTHILCQ